MFNSRVGIGRTQRELKYSTESFAHVVTSKAFSSSWRWCSYRYSTFAALQHPPFPKRGCQVIGMQWHIWKYEPQLILMHVFFPFDIRVVCSWHKLLKTPGESPGERSRSSRGEVLMKMLQIPRRICNKTPAITYYPINSKSGPKTTPSKQRNATNAHFIFLSAVTNASAESIRIPAPEEHLSSFVYQNPYFVNLINWPCITIFKFNVIVAQGVHKDKFKFRTNEEATLHQVRSTYTRKRKQGKSEIYRTHMSTMTKMKAFQSPQNDACYLLFFCACWRSEIRERSPELEPATDPQTCWSNTCNSQMEFRVGFFNLLIAWWPWM